MENGLQEAGNPGLGPSSAPDELCSWECLLTPVGLCFLLHFLPAKTSCICAFGSQLEFLRLDSHLGFLTWDWEIVGTDLRGGSGGHCLVPFAFQGQRAIVPAVCLSRISTCHGQCWADLHELTTFSFLIFFRTRDPRLSKCLLCHEQPSEL